MSVFSTTETKLNLPCFVGEATSIFFANSNIALHLRIRQKQKYTKKKKNMTDVLYMVFKFIFVNITSK